MGVTLARLASSSHIQASLCCTPWVHLETLGVSIPAFWHHMSKSVLFDLSLYRYRRTVPYSTLPVRYGTLRHGTFVPYGTVRYLHYRAAPYSYGVAPASIETYKALTLLHPAPGQALAHDLIDLFGEPRLVNVDRATATIHMDKMRECIAAAPPFPSPLRDG